MQEYHVKVFTKEETDFPRMKWFQNGKLHRLDGPAKEYDDGSKFWYQNGKLHRLDGPAIEYPKGDKFWYQNGKYHRLDGPAKEYANGSKCWYIDGVEYTEEEFNKLNKTTCLEKTIIIDGVEYKLVKK